MPVIFWQTKFLESLHFYTLLPLHVSIKGFLQSVFTPDESEHESDIALDGYRYNDRDCSDQVKANFTWKLLKPIFTFAFASVLVVARCEHSFTTKSSFNCNSITVQTTAVNFMTKVQCIQETSHLSTGVQDDLAHCPTQI